MDFMDFIYVCTNTACQGNKTAEAMPEPVGDRILVHCWLCGRKRDYSTECLNRSTPELLIEELGTFLKSPAGDSTLHFT